MCGTCVLCSLSRSGQIVGRRSAKLLLRGGKTFRIFQGAFRVGTTRLKLYCNRFGHFKDALVCSVNCPFRARCRDFALFYDQHRESVDALVDDYFAARRTTVGGVKPAAASALQPQYSTAATPPPAVTGIGGLIRLEMIREMNSFIWVGADDRAELMELEDVLRRAEGGVKAKHIFRVAGEMELRFQLVPRKGIEKAKRAAAAEAAAADGRAAVRRARTAANDDESNTVVNMPAANRAQQSESPITAAAAAPRRARRQG